MGSVMRRPARICEVPLFEVALAAAAANLRQLLGEQLTDAWLAVRLLHPRPQLVELVLESAWLREPERCLAAGVFPALVQQMEALLCAWARFSELSTRKARRREQSRLQRLHGLSRSGLLAQAEENSGVALFWGLARVYWLGAMDGLELPTVKAILDLVSQDESLSPPDWDAGEFAAATRRLLEQPLTVNPLHNLLRGDEQDLELFREAVELLSHRGKLGSRTLRLAVEKAVVLGPRLEAGILEALQRAQVSDRDLQLARDVCRRFGSVTLLNQTVIRPETFTAIGKRHGLSPSAMTQFKLRLMDALRPATAVE